MLLEGKLRGKVSRRIGTKRRQRVDVGGQVDVNGQKGFFVLEDAGERRFEECFGDAPECDRRL